MKNFKKLSGILLAAVALLFIPLDNVYAYAKVTSFTVANGRFSDETIMRLEDRATFNFDSNWDAYKLQNGGSTPNFYTSLNGVKYSINSVPSTFDSYSFLLKLKVAFSGTYTLSTRSLLNSSDNSLTIILEDRLENASYVLTENFVYEFAASTDDMEDRFVLHYQISQVSSDATDELESETEDAEYTDAEVTEDTNTEETEETETVSDQEPTNEMVDNSNDNTENDIVSSMDDALIIDEDDAVSLENEQNASEMAETIAPDNSEISVTVVFNRLQINFPESKEKYASIAVVNSEGKQIYMKETKLNNSTVVIPLDNGNDGMIYLVRIVSGKNTVCKKFYI